MKTLYYAFLAMEIKRKQVTVVCLEVASGFQLFCENMMAKKLGSKLEPLLLAPLLLLRNKMDHKRARGPKFGAQEDSVQAAITNAFVFAPIDWHVVNCVLVILVPSRAWTCLSWQT